MTKEVIDLHDWGAFKFKEFEYRLGGFYRGEDGNVRVVITEPIKGVDAVRQVAETYDGKWYHLHNVANAASKMNLMYEITKWAVNNIRRAPADATGVILEHLKGDGYGGDSPTTPKGEAVSGNAGTPKEPNKTGTRPRGRPPGKKTVKNVTEGSPEAQTTSSGGGGGTGC